MHPSIVKRNLNESTYRHANKQHTIDISITIDY